MGITEDTQSADVAKVAQLKEEDNACDVVEHPREVRIGAVMRKEVCFTKTDHPHNSSTTCLSYIRLVHLHQYCYRAKIPLAASASLQGPALAVQ